MHELSVCLALIEQVDDVAQEHGGGRVEKIVVRLGPLSGVEADLLSQAYPIAIAGTVAEDAELVVESMPIVVRCVGCDAESEVPVNKLTCPECGEIRTRIVSGDEMLLARVEIATSD